MVPWQMVLSGLQAGLLQHCSQMDHSVSVQLHFAIVKQQRLLLRKDLALLGLAQLLAWESLRSLSGLKLPQRPQQPPESRLKTVVKTS